MKQFFNFLFKKNSTHVVEDNNNKGNCNTCKFADYINDCCTVNSTHIDANKGLHIQCYFGEFWESKK